MGTYVKSIIVVVVFIFVGFNIQAQSADKKAVITVMKTYKDAIQNLTTEGTMSLFTKEATVFESGGSEGTYKNYVAHHLGPELGHFNRFSFSNYKIDVVVELPFAFVTETYIYTIDLKANKKRATKARIIKKKGVATSVLKKIKGEWKITKTHSSSRNTRK
ncbi:MAG: nuclear transport factor 2 family protein [Flavobacteriaceae bacterium]|nr:nuclear transport factor 2 family protein [Flavobacteriaceae bacterium]